jgi:hypothetical protein
MKTRNVALTIAAALVLALVAPVLGQPFADVPTNHWAYDAIAELAAKGLVEGYPDGTFKGNQPMTRYEMAMIVARIIARIEAIPTPPPPPPPEVRAADLAAVRTALTATQRDVATLQRLVNEFRAELQALGVRVTALEEELSALRARLDNTRITGDMLWWYTARGGSVGGLGGGLAGVAFAGGFPLNDLTRVRLTYTGTVADNVSVTLRARYYTASGIGIQRCTGATSGATCAGAGGTTGSPEVLDWDRLYVDWRNAFGMEGLTLRIGRQVITLGPVGLLLDEAAHGQRRDGVSATWRLGGVSILAAAQFKNAFQNTSETLYSGRLAFDLIPGWTLGLNVRVDHDPWLPPNQGSGFSGDLTTELIAGLKLAVEYATYNAPNAPPPTTRNFFLARLDLDFNRLSGSEIAMSPRLGVWYKNLDSVAGTPLAGFAGGQYFSFQDVYFGNNFLDPLVHNLQGWGARLDLQLVENLGAFVTYETYDEKGGGGTLNIWSVGAAWTVAPRTTVNLFYANLGHSPTGQSAQAGGVYVTTSW